MNRQLALAAILTLLPLLAGCAEKKASGGPPQSTTAVSIGTAEIGDVPIEVRAVGSVEARRSVGVRARIDGEILRVAFVEGQSVREGDLLFTIDPRPYRAALAEAQATLARDVARATAADADARRYADLVEKDYVTRQDAENIASTAAASRATVLADSAAVESARLDLEFCTIRAPISGRTGHLAMREGNLVRANDSEPLVTINQISPIDVSFPIPEERLSEVRAAQRTEAPSVGVAPPARPDDVVNGTLSFIDNAVDEGTGTVKLKATFENGAENLWPGQFVNVTLRLGAERSVTIVPSGAVQTGQKGAFLFVLKPDQTVELRPVTVGRRVDGRTVVQGELAAGEQVVTDGQLRLTNGAKVSVKPPVGSANGAPGEAPAAGK